MPQSDHMDIGVFGVRGIPSTYSGFETFLTALLPELARRGHRVTIYCRRYVPRGDGAGTYSGVRQVWLPSIATKQLDTLTHGWLCAAAAMIPPRSHDAMLVCNVANAPACRVITRAGIPVILNTDGQEWLRGKWGLAARTYFRWCASIAGSSATALVSDCNAMRAVYLSEFKAESSVIPYCWESIDSSTDRPNGPSMPTLLSELAVEKRRFFVAGGRLVPENNVEVIAEGYARTDVPLPLLVLGTANYNSSARRKLRALEHDDGRIRLVGHVASRARYRALISSALAYLHGHSVGGMNPSLVEAMAAGALIAALDTPFNREVLGAPGIYFQRSTSSISNIVTELGTLDAALATEIRTGNRRRAMSNFPLSAIAEAYESLLGSVSDRGTRARPVRMTTRWEEPLLSRRDVEPGDD